MKKINDALPNSLIDSTMSPNVNDEKNKLGYVPWLTTFGGKRGMLELWDGD
jgi:hypothetical protein